MGGGGTCFLGGDDSEHMDEAVEMQPTDDEVLVDRGRKFVHLRIG